MEVYLIRHTTPEVRKGICYGQADIKLAKTFRAEKNKVIAQLPHQFDELFSSPLSRCEKLAEVIPSKYKSYDRRLTEMNFGEWEMKNWGEIDPIALSKWMENYIELAPPKGESLLDLRNRVAEFWGELEIDPAKKVGIITHGGVIRVILGLIHQTPLGEIMNYKIYFGQVIPIKVS